MRLDEPGLHNDVVRLDLLEESDRARLGGSGAVSSMWDWLPVIPSGTNFNAYFDLMLAMKQKGKIIPFSITRKSDGAFGARMRRVEFPVAATNVRAISSLERLGARKEGVLRRYMRLADGSWADLAILSLVDSEIRVAIDLLKDRVAEIQLA